MQFGDVIRHGYSTYAKFDGRVDRTTYWLWVLYQVLAAIVLSFIDDSGLLSGLWSLAHLVPNLGLLVRRLHDTGRSGAHFFWVFLPFVGAIVLLVFLVGAGDTEENSYGPVPVPATT